MGFDLQGHNDHKGGNRSSGPSLYDPGTSRAKRTTMRRFEKQKQQRKTGQREKGNNTKYRGMKEYVKRQF